ncbi:MAG TPA: MFS transporter, partial [Sphingomicrobium sp.]|nr:MFS transporter [Sphingomicrobium sp.]
AILAGHWSDAANRRRLPMIAASIAMAAALFVLALQAFWLALLGAYVLFHAGLTAFLSVDSAMVNQLVADSHRRGELLGFMNLTNTLPAIIIPVIAMTSISGTEALNWSAAFALAGVLALAAGVLVRQVRTIR